MTEPMDGTVVVLGDDGSVWQRKGDQWYTPGEPGGYAWETIVRQAGMDVSVIYEPRGSLSW